MEHKDDTKGGGRADGDTKQYDWIYVGGDHMALVHKTLPTTLRLCDSVAEKAIDYGYIQWIANDIPTLSRFKSEEAARARMRELVKELAGVDLEGEN